MTDLIGPVTAGLKEAPTPALHHPAGEPAEEEKLAGSSETPILVTYKEFVPRGPRSSPLVRGGSREEEPLLGVPRCDRVVVVLAYEGCRLWQVLNWNSDLNFENFCDFDFGLRIHHCSHPTHRHCDRRPRSFQTRRAPQFCAGEHLAGFGNPPEIFR